MSTALSITRMEQDAAALRRRAQRTVDPDQVRRLLAIAMILDGASRLDAERQTGMDRQTMREWVLRYNTGGIDTLASRKPPGMMVWMAAIQMNELCDLVIKGPDPEKHKIIRWHRVDLSAEVQRRFSISVCERMTGKWLRKPRLRPYPHHPKTDATAQEAFKKTSARI